MQGHAALGLKLFVCNGCSVSVAALVVQILCWLLGCCQGVAVNSCVEFGVAPGGEGIRFYLRAHEPQRALTGNLIPLLLIQHM